MSHLFHALKRAFRSRISVGIQLVLLTAGVAVLAFVPADTTSTLAAEAQRAQEASHGTPGGGVYLGEFTVVNGEIQEGEIAGAAIEVQVVEEFPDGLFSREFPPVTDVDRCPPADMLLYMELGRRLGAAIFFLESKETELAERYLNKAKDLVKEADDKLVDPASIQVAIDRVGKSLPEAHFSHSRQDLRFAAEMAMTSLPVMVSDLQGVPVETRDFCLHYGESMGIAACSVCRRSIGDLPPEEAKVYQDRTRQTASEVLRILNYMKNAASSQTSAGRSVFKRTIGIWEAIKADAPADRVVMPTLPE
jgi:hypothetical protein